MNTTILEKIKNAEFDTRAGFNSMGVSENWYNPYLLIKETFTEVELSAMTERELEILLKMADSATYVFY